MPVQKIKDWLFSNTESSKPVKSKTTASVEINLKKIKPYGDHLNDGAMQLSFTLPVKCSLEAKEAAKLYVEKMGLERVNVASAQAIGDRFTFFVVYGYSPLTLDFTKVKVPKPEGQTLSREEIEAYVHQHFKRKIVVVGATTGSDAHTVGIDAILNRKGYAGDYGFEAYDCFQVINLRAQVSNQELIQKAIEAKADVVLISKLVTQQDQHLKDLKEFVKLLKPHKEFASRLVKVVGGPRMTHVIAKKVGFDAGFGAGTLPSEVGSFVVHALGKKLK
ncbi:MAG: cobalamin-dependent protein [Deltaproteobacteria bacterium]|nr:cobalamin-dependent protein [Deltaproteobacteria bacterium]